MSQTSASTPATLPELRVRPRQRAAAVVAMVAAVVLILALVTFFIAELPWLIAAIVGVAVVGGGGWVTITERMPRRLIGIGLLVVGFGIIVWAIVNVAKDENSLIRWLLLVLGLSALTIIAARVALAHELHELDRHTGRIPHRPSHPVLLCNPWSGGGKVAKFDLKAKAEAMGVEVVMLDRGLDLAQLARDAIARGADCLGMAGGDGSQALVASIATEHGLPFVCISAGTRNHFAQDLGLDKEDPAAGLAAFVDGYERRIDFGTVGDRLFVNNVSLGVYATVVQEDSYREAKVDTAANLLPDLLGAQTEPFDLQFTTPDGQEIDGAFMILVSNNPYVSGLALDSFQRRTMDSGELGVLAVNTSTGAEAAALVARAALGVAMKDPNLHQFSCPSFEVRSRSGSAFAGIDGEALDLDTPLEFRIHPRGLLLLVPPGNLAAAMLRRTRGFHPSAIWSVANGRVPKQLRDELTSVRNTDVQPRSDTPS